jgi:hypothetical protein
MNKLNLIKELESYNPQDVEKFATYILKLYLEKDKQTKELKNPWIQNKTEKWVADKFREVDKIGLIFDGVHVTLQKTGISYDYVAFKNKMLLAYPESKIDTQLVYKKDIFTADKDSGSVNYLHKIVDPFIRTEKDIIGGYCVIKNKRGEFITLLNSADFDKHRKKAKASNIWNEWFPEMCLKTLIKKACKQHFDDIFSVMQEQDNENYNLDNPVELDVIVKQQIEEITTIDDLSKYYHAHKDKATNQKAFNKYISMRKEELQREVQNAA